MAEQQQTARVGRSAIVAMLVVAPLLGVVCAYFALMITLWLFDGSFAGVTAIVLLVAMLVAVPAAIARRVAHALDAAARRTLATFAVALAFVEAFALLVWALSRASFN